MQGSNEVKFKTMIKKTMFILLLVTTISLGAKAQQTDWQNDLVTLKKQTLNADIIADYCVKYGNVVQTNEFKESVKALWPAEVCGWICGIALQGCLMRTGGNPHEKAECYREYYDCFRWCLIPFPNLK